MRVSRRALVIVALSGSLAAAVSAAAQQGNSVTRPFAAGGRVRLDLSAGAYTIQAGRDDGAGTGAGVFAGGGTGADGASGSLILNVPIKPPISTAYCPAVPGFRLKLKV